MRRRGQMGRRAILRAGIIPALLAAVPLALPAQEPEPPQPVLRGRVVDATSGTPIAGALVRTVDDRPVITDDTGRFTLRPEGPGPWLLRVEQLGYAARSLTLSSRRADAPLRIALEPDPIALEGIQVTVDRLESRRRAYPGSVRTIRAEDVLRSAGTDLLSQLRPKIIGLHRCSLEGHLCFRRRGEVVLSKVCLDDRRSWDPAYELLSYPPEEIYLVEIYDGGLLVLVYTRAYMANRNATRGPRPPPRLAC